MKPILAHGILGPFDELMYIVPEIVFVLMMAYCWVRARKLPARSHPTVQDDAVESTRKQEPD